MLSVGFLIFLAINAFFESGEDPLFQPVFPRFGCLFNKGLVGAEPGWYDIGTGIAGISIQEICCLKQNNTLEIVP